MVVCIVAPDGSQDFDESLESILTHTHVDVPVVLTGEGLEAPHSTRVVLISAVAGVGRGAGVRAALTAAAPADVVVIRSDCIVAAGWLQGLRDAAYSDARVASAMPLMGADVTEQPKSEPREWIAQVAAQVRAASPRAWPRADEVGGPCVYLRRSALELVGDLESGGAWEAARFGERSVRVGLCHVLADDVVVMGREPTSLGLAELGGPLARSLSAARRAVKGLSVAVDARCLTGPMDGTKVITLQLIVGLVQTRRARVTAIVPPELTSDVRTVLESQPGLVIVVASAGALPPVRADVVHRPFQISSPADLTFLARLADRVVITHHDLISFHNPSYFPSAKHWKGYRALTRRALAAADQVLFGSEHARQDALAQELVDPERASVVHNGVDHAWGGDPLRPRGADRLPDDPEVMLCLGTDFRHKNRLFALKVLADVQERHAWSGWLVMAGPRMTYGSSRQDESKLLANHAKIAGSVLTLDAVTEAEKRWLLQRANLVLYPTVFEGFGLVPFEAAAHDVPCLWAPGTSLSEVLPDHAAGIVPWDVAATADRAIELMHDEAQARWNVGVVRDAGAGLGWDLAAQRLIELYKATCDRPPTPAGVLERVDGLMGRGISEDAVRLVGPEGVLPRDVERPLLALAMHPRLGRPLFRALRSGYRASTWWSRRARERSAG